MRRTRTDNTIIMAAIALLVLAVFGLAGCKKQAEPVKVEAFWPRADSERIVEKPVEPARWPLTGLPAPDEAATRVRIVSVKIENSAAARPQSNLDGADIVYETVTEGGITRFNALFHSRAPEGVGPVRSARLSDLYIVPQYGALFSHVGGNTQVMRGIRSGKLEDMDQFFNPKPYWRTTERSAPHNMYMSIERLREAAVKRGYAAAKEPQGLAFDFTSTEATPSVTSVTIPFSTANSVEWFYDAATKTYARSNNGRAHTDKVSGRQYQSRNVVVMWAKVAEQRKRDSAGSVTLEITLEGSGRVSIFRDGQRYDGTWEAAKSAPPVFRSADGKLMRLSPGVTWFQVVSSSTNISMQ